MLYVHVAKGSANRKLTGLPETEGGNARKDGAVWVINPVGHGDAPPEARSGRTYDTCPLSCRHLPERFGGTADADCYADAPLLWTADKVGGIPALDALLMVRDAIEAGKCSAVRWAVVGDIGRAPSERQWTTSFLSALRITCESRGVPLIIYTHTWGAHGATWDPAVNASCDSVEAIHKARDLGYQPVYVARDAEEAAAVIDEVGGFVCPEMADRASGCFAGRTSRSAEERKCGGAMPLCSIERRGATMVLLNH